KSKFPNIPGLKIEGKCDVNKWQKIKKQMVFLFDNECGELARSSVRLAFHDAANGEGGADGSILNFPLDPLNELTSGKNQNFNFINVTLVSIRKSFPEVSMADIIQFAGVLGTVLCPGGPRIPFVTNRIDATQKNDPSLLPGPSDSIATILAKNERAGLTKRELVALLGSHSCGKRFGASFIPDNNSAGLPFDSSPKSFDTKFYKEVLLPSPVVGTQRLPSDRLVATDESTKQDWLEFSENLTTFQKEFSDAFFKMGLLGQLHNTLADCTEILPKALNAGGNKDHWIPEKRKREFKGVFGDSWHKR
ncbi:hypothetical protein HK099_005121, partial [Clydaea vesicula]